MSPPSHVQAVCALTNVLLCACGLRDIFAPGTPLPMPGDDKLMLIFGSKSITKKKVTTVVAAPVEGTMLFIEQLVGAFLITMALAKLTIVFSNMNEGTFLRRNLFLVFGCCGLAIAYVMNLHAAHLQQTFGADITPFVAVFGVEGAVYTFDALFRARANKVR